MLAPPTFTPVSAGLSPSTVSDWIVTLLAWIKKTLLAAPPQRELFAHGFGAESAGLTTVLAAPSPRITALFVTTTFPT